MTKDQRPYCREILDRIRRIEDYTAAGRKAFMESELLQDGVFRSFEVIADTTDATLQALYALWEAQARACVCIFPTMTAWRNPKFEADTPMSALTIVRLLHLSSERAGIGHLSAHDLRRTHITLALISGAPLQDMQARAGHANAATTLRYAQPFDAKTRRLRIAF